MALSIADRLISFGFRVWLSKCGTYGFYSDDDGARVVSFQVRGGISFSGNYHASWESGTGWQIFTDMVPRDVGMAIKWLHCPAPVWANKSPTYTTVEQYLEQYGDSSGFVPYVP